MCWGERFRPQRLPANHRKPHGTKQLFAWYSVGADRLYGRTEDLTSSADAARAEGDPRASP